MNCDEAFELMTDPQRERADELQWHLDLCPRCRQMREVLAPALDLLSPHDAAPSGEQSPAFFPSESDEARSQRPVTLSADSLLLAERTAAELNASRRPERTARRWRALALLRYAAVFLMGAGIAFAAMNAAPDRRSGVMPTPSGAESCFWMTREAAASVADTTDGRTLAHQCLVCHNGR